MRNDVKEILYRKTLGKAQEEIDRQSKNALWTYVWDNVRRRHPGNIVGNLTYTHLSARYYFHD